MDVLGILLLPGGMLAHYKLPLALCQVDLKSASGDDQWGRSKKRTGDERDPLEKKES